MFRPKALSVALILALSTSAAHAASAPPKSPAITPAEAAVLYRALLGADWQGLRSADYLTPEIEQLLTSPDPTRQDQASARLFEATIRFAQDLKQGRTAPRAFRSDWAIRPPQFDARAELERSLADGRVEAWLASLPPDSLGYSRLVPEAVHYQDIVDRGGWRSLDARRPMKVGTQGVEVEAIRKRLAMEGAAPAPDGDPRTFDKGLEVALTAYQSSHGLPTTGEADRRTLESLNVPAATRLASIRASLERWRWAPRSLPATRVEVNVAAAELQVFLDGRPALAMRTVVGRPADPTPMFTDVIEAIVFNPPWNVPDTIAANEILPKAARDPGYLARENFVWIEREGRRRLQQKAGPTSALGLYKFDLPNPFNVYLHDTPNRSVFGRDVRSLSHGCVRLQEPRALAALLLGRQGWSPEAVDAAVTAGETRRVRLDQPVPVYLFYFTAFVTDAGVLNFRDDVYGWDRNTGRGG